jgi:hypothetical protein
MEMLLFRLPAEPSSPFVRALCLDVGLGQVAVGRICRREASVPNARPVGFRLEQPAERFGVTQADDEIGVR